MYPDRFAHGLRIGFWLLLLITAWVSFGMAQTAAQTPQASRMTELDIRSGMGPEFEKFLKTDFVPALKKAGVKDLSVFKTAVFGPANRYILTSPITGLSELDNPNPLVKAIGQDGVSNLMVKMQQFAESARNATFVSVPNLAIDPPAGYAGTIGFEVKMAIAPGHDVDYFKNAKAAMDVVRKTNAKGAYAIRMGLGGNPNEFRILVLLDSFADMEKFGQSFGKLATEAKLAPMTDVVTHVEYAIFRYLPELSIAAPAQ